MKNLTYSQGFIKSMRSFDIFSKPSPSFNYRGQSSVKTYCGTLCSWIVLVIVIIYASIKSIHLESRRGPIIAQYAEPSPYGKDFPISMKKKHARFAFSFEGFRDNKMKIDPTYVKWIFRMFTRSNG